ncbi:hypothetical protein Q4489_05225 [Thalassotalea sp. 1_MG-2023]|uniref:hypothetical protein n=1 Tax=Thalassotalea sp. 1_MG-2023 TaxID=3062680 RepID=UPI0026E3DE30|nr:hypothetical protein [Thalassotalea sp. 1_MG-2023]MDO6426403.1 hypothetical protein [Thalassotalea sp. 1_MG-2023]
MFKYLLSLCMLILAVYFDEKVTVLRKGDFVFFPFILGVLPSFISALFLPLAYSLFKEVKLIALKTSYGIVIGLFFYELSQVFIAEATFDYYDLIFTLLGGLLFTIIFYSIRYFK